MPETMELLTPEFMRRLEQLELTSRRILQGRMKGERRSKRRGSSVEFADHREYVMGDDLRFIDWNVMIRLDRLFIKLFEEEEDLHFHVLVDNSLSMDFGSPTKLHYAKQIAAALCFVGAMNLDRVHVSAFGSDLTASIPGQRGRRGFMQILNFLNKIEPDKHSDLNRSLKSFAMKHPGRKVVVVISDFMMKGGYETGLRYLVSGQMDPYAIQVLCQEEIEPEITGDLALIDCEDDDLAEVTISAPLLARYKKTLAGFQQQLREFCTKRGIIFAATSNQTPFERLILAYLRERGLLK